MFNSIINNLTQLPGWKTNKKIVVIESDDWGSIRMPNNQILDYLNKKDPSIKNDLYCRLDNLENADDLNALFDVLKKHKDINGNYPIITANTVVANPDFEQIKNLNFEDYKYETFTETLNNYYPNQNVFSLYNQGISERLFCPQFHGREHINIKMWLDELKRNNKILIEAFSKGVFGIPVQSNTNIRGNFMAAFDLKNNQELEKLKIILNDGLGLFETIFNYKSKSIISPCYVWPDEIGKTLVDNGVKGYQGMKFQFRPRKKSSGYNRKYHYTGQKESNDLIYLVRNVFFEPSHFNSSSHISDIISKVNTAFKWKNPVIIGSHRINFIGSLDEVNRRDNLKKLDYLLKSLLTIHPDIEFYSTEELINQIMVGGARID
jgi:hypothetical protein